MKMKFKKLNENATIPSYAHDGDSGMDISSVECTVIPPHSYRSVKTGLSAEIPRGYEMQVRPRSGLAFKKGVVAAFGTVDSGYRGEIGIALYNHSDIPYHVFAGERIAQLVVSPVICAEICETEEIDCTERGESGFGSTGR